ncbi:hypothetical protein M9Y10_035760 [Tritrichomonas musculus]|uniref:MIF4G domain-containing protein n=1 Tax=Tritrichomonas musculus TaxID=1915356 RepID=A0ABR2GYB8_9EUKA
MSSSQQPSGEKQGKNFTITTKTGGSINTNKHPFTPSPATNKTSGLTVTKPGGGIINIERPKREKSRDSLFDGIQPKQSTPAKLNIETAKPQTPKIKVEKANKNKKNLNITFQRFKYTIEEAFEFRDLVRKYLDTVENKKISDESFITMSSLLNRFKFSQRHKNPQPRPQRTDYKKQEHKITTELNKLTLDNFMNIIDSLTIREENFLDINYLKTLATCLVRQASLQPLFSSLYSLSATSISSVLDNTEYAASRQAFCQTLIAESKKEVEGSINSTSKFASDSAVGSASFFGFLANREFVSIDECFNLVKKSLENVTASNIEICRQLLIPAGEKIENKYPEEFKKIVQTLEVATKDKNIPGVVRYPLIDLLEARSNDWNTKPLMHQIASTKSSSKARAANLTQMSAKPIDNNQPVQTISVAKNKFALLLSDDDDDFVEEEANENAVEDDSEFDGEDMIRRYVIDNEISTNWHPSHVGDLLFAIALRPNKEISKAMKLLQILNDNNNFATTKEEEQNAFDAMVETVQRCTADEVADNYKHAIENCGTIYARLVYFGISSVDQFGDVFPVENFHIEVVLTFLLELIKLKKVDLIKESQYWIQYKWRPANFSNLEITSKIFELPEDKSNIIFDLFPLYDCLSHLQDDIYYIANPDEGEEAPDLKSEIENFPPDVVADPAFATGAIEVLMKENMCFDIVLPLLEQNKLYVLLWVENYGKHELRDSNEIAKLINNIAKSGNYDLDSFLNEPGDEKHQEIVQLLRKK